MTVILLGRFSLENHAQLYHCSISSLYLSGLHMDHLDFLIHYIKWKTSIMEREWDCKIETNFFCFKLLHPMIYGSGEYKIGEETIFQSNSNSWSGPRPNHHFSKFLPTHERQILTIWFCILPLLSLLQYRKNSFQNTKYSEKKKKRVRNLEYIPVIDI